MSKIITTFFLFTALIGYSQKYQIDKLIGDFSSGKLFIINELAIAEADSIFFTELSKTDIEEYKIIDSISGKLNYGTLGSKGVFELTVSNTSRIADLYVGLIDASVLKYFDEDKDLFYMTDGAPNSNIYYALNILINKSIDEVTVLDKYQSKAIWGTEAKNGAIQVICDRKKALKF
jgi:hypothetical protein